MFRGRGKHVVAAAGAGLLLAVTSLAVVPLVAGAAGSAGTTTTVTAAPPSTTTGGAVNVTAEVAPVTTNAHTPTGTVVFTITGGHSGTASCKKGDTVKVKGGKAVCKVLKGQLLAADSPYTISGAYSGDTNFAVSSGSTSVVVGKATTSLKLKAKPKVKSDTANTFTATIKAGGGSALLAGGQVTFAVSDSPQSKDSLRKCAGGDTQTVTVKKGVGTATCVLQSGWFKVPAKSKSDPHPSASYSVSASFATNSNFVGSAGTLSGVVM
jgi:Big-like domain-containing protein